MRIVSEVVVFIELGIEHVFLCYNVTFELANCVTMHVYIISVYNHHCSDVFEILFSDRCYF